MHISDGGVKMDQKITIRISDREYTLTAYSPEQEEQIRKSALMVNRMIDTFQRRYNGRDVIDIMSFVALNQGISNIALLQKVEDIEKECRDLKKELEEYLENI